MRVHDPRSRVVGDSIATQSRGVGPGEVFGERHVRKRHPLQHVASNTRAHVVEGNQHALLEWRQRPVAIPFTGIEPNGSRRARAERIRQNEAGEQRAAARNGA